MTTVASDASPRPWQLWYDDQCEVCQAGVAWISALDRRGRVKAWPLSSVTSPGSAPPAAALEAMLHHLHVQRPDGRLLIGAQAVAALARLFPLTWLFGALFSVPPFTWLARAMYGWVAENRHSLSRCRGGACTSFRQDLVREKSAWRSFQTCRVVGWAAVTPLALWLGIARLWRNLRTWQRTRGRTARLLEGRLAIGFLGGGLSFGVSLLFGELFTAVRYGSVLVDPGGTRMRRSLQRFLGGQGSIRFVVPTHAHEEHCGNLSWAAQQAGAKLLAHPRVASFLAHPPRLPMMRRLAIGQWDAISAVDPLPPRDREGESDEMWCLEAPGHCAEQVCLYFPKDKLLLAGDAFMGTHFTSPNDDVDHRAWLNSIDRLLALDIEVMVEAHGHVHTARPDILADLAAQGLSCIASRRDPRLLLEEKRAFLQWVDEQVRLGESDGLPAAALSATVFPWTQRWSYETALQDAVARAISAASFGRHKVVRSFRRVEGVALPMLLELRLREP